MKAKKWLFIILFIIAIIMISLGAFIIFNNKKTFQFDLILPYSYVGNIIDQYITVRDGEKFGYVDQDGKILFPLEYPILDSMKNSDGTPNLDRVGIKDSMAIYTTDMMLYGVKDTEKKDIIPANYSELTIINENLFLVYNLSNYYFINATNQKAFDEEFPLVEIYSDLTDVFLVLTNDGLYNLFTSDGNFLLDKSYQQINKMYDASSNTHLFIATNGNYIDYYLYQDNKLLKLDDFSSFDIQQFEDGNIIFQDSNGNYISYSILNQTKKSYKNDYISLSNFSNGLALVVNEDGLAGFIDENEQLVIPYQYNLYHTSSFTDYGLAVAGKDDLVGVINKDNEEVLPFNYTYVEIIDENKFIVIDQDNNASIIDKNGNQLTHTKYQTIVSTNYSDYFIASQEIDDITYYGLIDDNGNEITDLNYLNLVVEDHYILAEQEGKFFLKWL